ncbi:uncharacterized protein LOC119104459 isoform X2 [Pollicipes pollicipes]|nr:uncharacterized protein LOC119104459 isoform X2 [Pollicipes pollicipes]
MTATMLTVLLLAMLHMAVAQEHACREEGDEVVCITNDGAVRFLDKEATWQQAHESCRRRDTFLITSEDVAETVMADLQRHELYRQGDFWVGAKYLRNGYYHWVFPPQDQAAYSRIEARAGVDPSQLCRRVALNGTEFRLGWAQCSSHLRVVCFADRATVAETRPAGYRPLLTVLRDGAAVESTDDNDGIDTVLQVSNPDQLAHPGLTLRCGDGDSVVKDHFVLGRSEYQTSWWRGNFTVLRQLMPPAGPSTLGVGAFWCQRYVSGAVDAVISKRLFVTTSKNMHVLVGSRAHVVNLLQALLSGGDDNKRGSQRQGEADLNRELAGRDFETELRRLAKRAREASSADLRYLAVYDFFDPSTSRKEATQHASETALDVTVTLLVDVFNVSMPSIPMAFRCQAESASGTRTADGEVTRYRWKTVATSSFVPSDPECVAADGVARVERRCIPSLDGGATWGAFCAAGACDSELPACGPPPAVCPAGFLQNDAVFAQNWRGSVPGPLCMLRLNATHARRKAECRSRHPKAFEIEPHHLPWTQPAELQKLVGDRPVWLSSHRLWQEGPLWPLRLPSNEAILGTQVDLDLDGNLDCVILTPDLVLRSVDCSEVHTVLCVVRAALYSHLETATVLWTPLNERPSHSMHAPTINRDVSVVLSDSPVSWALAAVRCAETNSSLASVTSRVYRDTVRSLIRSLFLPKRLKLAVNLVRQDELRWGDATPLSYPALSPSLSARRHDDRAIMDASEGQYSLISAEEFTVDGAVCEQTASLDAPKLHLFNEGRAFGAGALKRPFIFMNVTNPDKVLLNPRQFSANQSDPNAFFECFVSTSQSSEMGYRVVELSAVKSEDPPGTFVKVQLLVDFGYLICGAYAMEPHGYILSNALLLTERTGRSNHDPGVEEFLVGLRPVGTQNRTRLQFQKECDPTFCQGVCPCFSMPQSWTGNSEIYSVRLRPLRATRSGDGITTEHYLATLTRVLSVDNRQQHSVDPAGNSPAFRENETGNSEEDKTGNSEEYGAQVMRNSFGAQLVSLKQARCCPWQRTERPERLTWQRTCTGDPAATSLELCTDEDGHPVLRYCLGDPLAGVAWGPVTPEDAACAAVSSTSIALHKLGRTEVNAKNVGSTVGQLAWLLRAPARLVAQDVVSVAVTLENAKRELVFQPPATAVAARGLQITVVTVVDHIMNADKRTLKKATKLVGAGPRIVRALEDILSISSSLNLPFVTRKNVAVRAGAFRGVTSSSQDIQSSSVQPMTDASQLSVSFGQEAALVLIDSQRTVNATFLTFRDGRLLHSPGRRIASQVVSVLIQDANAEDAPWKSVENVPWRTVLTKFRSHVGPCAPIPACAFWDFHAAEWSTRGCRLKEIRDGSTVCLCSHLGSFALVLNDTRNAYLSKMQHRLLDILTYVGIAFSLLGLACTMLTFVLFKKWRRPRGNQIMMHLSAALTGMYISFLGGLAATKYPVACVCLSALLHYFVLAAFGWMAVEAVFQYLRFVRVIGTYIPCFMLKASVCAWGFALVPVVVMFLVAPDCYEGDTDVCWIDYDSFYDAFAYPVLAVIAFNAAVFGMVVYSLSCGRQQGLRTNQSERRQARIRLRMVFVIFVLFGLPWVFGFMAIREARFFFAILFCICNMFQGFVIFVMMVAGERSGRELWSTFLVSKYRSVADKTRATARAQCVTKLTNSATAKEKRGREETRL